MVTSWADRGTDRRDLSVLGSATISSPATRPRVSTGDSAALAPLLTQHRNTGPEHVGHLRRKYRGTIGRERN